ncbi:MAG: hypothetical protein EOO47_11330 [Flavobacterium sp.]|nr:MAG: hypothetical protein EOO47_11330 [Flavobacterium sp.]
MQLARGCGFSANLSSERKIFVQLETKLRTLPLGAPEVRFLLTAHPYLWVWLIAICVLIGALYRLRPDYNSVVTGTQGFLCQKFAECSVLYKTKLLKDPIIDLSVVNLKVTLLGEFSKQGNFLLERENTTLIDIIGEAGGITKTADPKSLKIIRGDRSNPELIYVNLSDINSLASKKLTLQNNDIIILQQTRAAEKAEKIQNYNNIIQPVMIVFNLAILVFTLTR